MPANAGRGAGAEGPAGPGGEGGPGAGWAQAAARRRGGGPGGPAVPGCRTGAVAVSNRSVWRARIHWYGRALSLSGWKT